jgi:DNA-directed RNA polymerase subunit H
MDKEFNITKHSLVLEHTKLTDKEKEEFLTKHNIVINQLPMILLSDPAIEHLDLQVEDVIKIKRKSPTNLESIFYRVVVYG